VYVKIYKISFKGEKNMNKKLVGLLIISDSESNMPNEFKLTFEKSKELFGELVNEQRPLENTDGDPTFTVTFDADASLEAFVQYLSKTYELEKFINSLSSYNVFVTYIYLDEVTNIKEEPFLITLAYFEKKNEEWFMYQKDDDGMLEIIKGEEVLSFIDTYNELEKKGHTMKAIRISRYKEVEEHEYTK
jgi:hypothetical protein